MDVFGEIIKINPPLFEDRFKRVLRYYKDKRWFEMGNLLEEVLSLEGIVGNRYFLYQCFIEGISRYLNPNHFLKIVLAVVNDFSSPDEGIEFLIKIIESYEREMPLNDVLRLRVVQFLILNGDFEGSIQILHEIKSRMTESTPLSIRSSFYKTLSSLDKARGDYEEFYISILQYLSTSQIKEDMIIAFDLCAAALISKNVSSFQEVAAHPITQSLLNTEQQWIYDLILLLNKGSSDIVSTFDEIYAQKLLNSRVFSPYLSIIRQKVEIAVLIGLVLSRPYDSRVFSFKEVSETCSTEHSKVEWLVMKALSSGIIQGEIDQIEEKVIITWCKPKGLGKERLQHIKKEVDRWKDVIHGLRLKMIHKSQTMLE